MVYYDGSHSISFINQDWNVYSDFTHNFEEGIQNGIPKVKYLGHLRRDGRAHDDRNTWEDWGLVPTSRPTVSPAAQKTSVVEVPGTSGNVDLSYILTPWPTFQNRTGSWEFYITDIKRPRILLEQEIGAFLHGRDVRVVLQDDPAYYYEGRCEIGGINVANDGSFSTITINYDLQPYKKCIYNSIEEWEWNPFNFETDYISKNIFGDQRLIRGICTGNIQTIKWIAGIYLNANSYCEYKGVIYKVLRRHFTRLNNAPDTELGSTYFERYAAAGGYLEFNNKGAVKVYLENGKIREGQEDPTNDDIWSSNYIQLTSDGKYQSITGSMPAVPKIKITFIQPNSASHRDDHSTEAETNPYCFIYLRYSNFSIRNSIYTAAKKWYVKDLKLYDKEIDGVVVKCADVEFTDPEIIFYDTFKRRTYDIGFYTNCDCLISLEFTKGEIL